MKKIVINGAGSMLGINLIEYAIKKNTEVLAIIRENSIKRSLMPDSNLVKVIECDLDNLHSIKIDESGYDAFYHFAWAGTIGEERNDTYSQEMNIKYTLDSVNLAARIGAEKFIGAGSQAECGKVDGKINPNTKTNPENGYGAAKLCAGIMGKSYAKNLGIDFIWTRILSVYGKYNDERTMIMSTIKAMLDGRQIKYTKAEQQWDYLYSEDAAKALYLIGESGKNNEIYCIGSGCKRELREYIEIIRNQINPEIELKFGEIPYQENQVMNLVADITNLTKDTGFVPETTFEEGIKKTIDWYKENHKIFI